MAIGDTVGVGLTIIKTVCGAPPHPFANGVTVIVDETGIVLAFRVTKGAMFPVPVEERPIPLLLLDQL